MTPMIPKNTTIPTSKTEIFSTAADSQPSVEVHVLQGERPMAGDNKSLGRFILDGIPPAPRGIPQVEVMFDVDANGILSVTATDKATSKKQSIRIEGSTGLKPEEVERLKKEAEVHAEEDRKRKENVEVHNAAENIIYVAEKSIRDWGEKLTPELKSQLEEKIKRVKDVKDSGDKAAIEQAAQELGTALQEIGKQMYGKGESRPEDPSPQAQG